MEPVHALVMAMHRDLHNDAAMKLLPASDAEAKEKLRKFGKVAIIGFGIASVQYALVMVFGFLTFGKAATGNVLLNYDNLDPWAAAARVAVGLSTLFGYPMQFAGLDISFELHFDKSLESESESTPEVAAVAIAYRAAEEEDIPTKWTVRKKTKHLKLKGAFSLVSKSVLDSRNKPLKMGQRSEVFKIDALKTGPHRLATASLLAVAVGIACVFRDLGQFQAIEGAMLAAFLIFAAGPIMALKLPMGKAPGARLRFRGLLVLGVAFMCIGC
ncbi:avt5, partial [Symbiodinium sp. KB8]